MSCLPSGVTLKPDYSRIISKSGDTNISSISVANRSTKYFTDICTTLIDIQWRWNLLLFFSGFTFTWVVFAAYYILLTYLHGDQFEQDDDWLPCVENVHNYASALLFSIETMSTIGYGYRYVTEACPGAYLGVIAQSVLGAALQFALAGLVVAKVKRAKKRRTTILYSKVACIYAEDLKLRLAIRIGDMRKSDIIGAHAHAYFIRKSFSKTGDKIPVEYFYMNFQSEGGDGRLFLPWPTYIIHNINEDSPLYNLSRDDAMNENFEMIVVLEAVSSTLSASFQVRKSYHPWEIRWGHRFLSLGHTYEDMFDENIVDYENFHETKPVTTPMVSAQDIDEMSLKGDISPEKLQERRDSRVETDFYMRHRKSVTDTFLGAETDLSVSEFSMSDTSSIGRIRKMSAIDRLRKMSTTTYHGPGTMDRRKSVGNIFGPPISLQRARRHSTGQFLEPDTIVRSRRNSREVPLVGNVLYNLEKERSRLPKLLDIKSETHEESGPRYVRNKKRVTLNPNPITEPPRKISDPGTQTVPLASALQKRRRHSTWQFAEQDAFIKDFKKLNQESYAGPQLEVVESDQQESSHGGDIQDYSRLDHAQEVSVTGKGSTKSTHLKTVVEETEESSGRRVVYGSFRKKYIVQKIPEIIISEHIDASDEEDTDIGASADKEPEQTECQEDINAASNDDEKDDSTCSIDSTPEQLNPAFMYDSEDDIGYSRNIVHSDDEDSTLNYSQINNGYVPDV